MIIESITNPNARQEIDQTHQAARVSLRPIEHALTTAVGGHFRISARSGAITGAGVIANAPLFSMRWTQPSFLFVLTFLEAYYVPTVVFTAAQELGLEAILASGFTASDSAGVGIGITGASTNRVRRLGMQPSLITDLRIATTTLLTAGTRTLDAFGFCGGAGLVNVVNAAAGTAYVNPGGNVMPFGFRYEPTMERGEHPVVIASGEGLIVRNTIAFPAAGTVTLIVNMAWAEIPTF